MQPEQWPPELDALIAAPEHHKLLFENERVRVIDANIAVGVMTAVPTHCFAASEIANPKSINAQRPARRSNR